MAQNQASLTQLRDHYLQTLGIVQYVSRGIADEVVVDNPVDSLTDSTLSEGPVVESPVMDSPDVQSPIISVEAIANHQSEIEGILQDDVEDKSYKKPSKVISNSIGLESDIVPLELKFVFWQPTDHLLIATTADDQLPDSQQVNLLARIVATIDNQSSGLPQFDVVSWPLHPSMQGGEQEAREFIATLVESKLAAKSTRLLLVLGESAENWLLSAAQKLACQQGLLAITPEVTAIIAPSLTQMLNQPQSKRDTWQTICHYFNKKSA